MRGWKEIHRAAKTATPEQMERLITDILREKQCPKCLKHWKRYNREYPILAKKNMRRYVDLYHDAVDELEEESTWIK